MSPISAAPHAVPPLQRRVPPPARSPSRAATTPLFPQLQFPENCSRVGPFRGVQTYRSRLLQRGSTTGSRVLPGNLLLGSSPRPRLLPGARSSPGSPGAAASLRACQPAPPRGPPQAEGMKHGCRLHCGPPRVAEGPRASPWSSPWAEGEPLLQCLVCSRVCRAVSFRFFSLPSLTPAEQHFYPFQTRSLLRCHHSHCWAQPCPATAW